MHFAAVNLVFLERDFCQQF